MNLKLGDRLQYFMSKTQARIAIFLMLLVSILLVCNSKNWNSLWVYRNNDTARPAFHYSSDNQEALKRERRQQLVSHLTTRADSVFDVAGENYGKYGVLTESGKIDPSCVRECNLNESDIVVVENSFREHFQKMQNLMALRIQKDDTTGSRDEKYEAFFIPSFQQDGKALLAELVETLDAQLGLKKSNAIFGGYPAKAMFFGYGSYDVRVRVINAYGDENGKTTLNGTGFYVETRMFQPETGELTAVGRYDLADFNKGYGKLFKVE